MAGSRENSRLQGAGPGVAEVYDEPASRYVTCLPPARVRGQSTDRLSTSHTIRLCRWQDVSSCLIVMRRSLQLMDDAWAVVIVADAYTLSMTMSCWKGLTIENRP